MSASEAGIPPSGARCNSRLCGSSLIHHAGDVFGKLADWLRQTAFLSTAIVLDDYVSPFDQRQLALWEIEAQRHVRRNGGRVPTSLRPD